MTTYIFSYTHPMDKTIAFVIEPTRFSDGEIIEGQFDMKRYGDFPTEKSIALLDSIVKWIACYRAIEELHIRFSNGNISTCALCNLWDIQHIIVGNCQKCPVAQFNNGWSGCMMSPYKKASYECLYVALDKRTADPIANEIGFLIAVHRHFYGKLPVPIYNAIPRDVYCRWKNYEARI